jgi:hypothetical protein
VVVVVPASLATPAVTTGVVLPTSPTTAGAFNTGANSVIWALVRVTTDRISA